MSMKRRLKILWVSVVLAVVLAGVVLAILFSPTPAPPQKSINFLKVVRALTDLQGRVETKKSGADGAIPFPSLDESEVQKIVQQSEGLIRQVKLRSDGAIAVQANIASSQRNVEGKSSEVNVLLVPEKAEKGYYWRCFGEPISYLPTFCEKLK